MTTCGALPSLFFAMAMVANGSIARAEARKNATQAAKPTSSADPFEEPSAPTKPGAGAPAATPAKSPTTPPTAPPAQALPSKELEAFMRGFEGNWRCETKFPAGAMGPGSQTANAKTDITIKKEFGGFAWHGEFKLAKTTTTAATSGVFQVSYAASTKQATFLSYDSLGSAMMGTGALAGDSVTFAFVLALYGVVRNLSMSSSRQTSRMMLPSTSLP